ncbi:MAG: PSD1 and planctomycete cytochrome C domain-containing protein [Gemmataceae bacterium]|nr:PSD1 and planctomycete cytochrome C domain-containing protein [Gemmataceae bacterium]
MAPSPSLFLAALILVAAADPAFGLDEPREAVEFFETKIRPVLAEHCFKCHSGRQPKGKLSLDNRAGAFKGGESGAAFVPGQPEKSLLLKALRYADPELRMPPRGKLDDRHVADFARWIEMGAPWPDDGHKTLVKKDFDLRERSKHWSLQPLTFQPLPLVKNAAWIRSPIDRFILAKLEEKGIPPAPAADKRTLLRRVTFDLTGLPPTPAEIDAFLNDDSAGAYSKVVDRLLASPSAASPQADEADPDNKLLHRMPVRRLEAEAIRDAVLAVSGRLDKSMHGPSVQPHLSAFMVGRGRPAASGPLDGDGRRSIYLAVRRNFLNPLFLAFDYPTPFSTMGKRSVSNVPAQALVMMNSPFIQQQAELWAKHVLAQPKLTPRERLEKMYVAAFARPPSHEEEAEALAFLAGRTEAVAWTELAHVLFNVKEFMFVK